MSRTSRFVQGSDHKFYRNPVLYGDDWYLCFEDSPEVVVKTTVKRTAQKLAGERLREAGVVFRWAGADSVDNRMFPPAYTGFHKSFAFFVELREALPVGGPATLKHDGCTDYPSTECAFYTFTLDFDAADVAKLFLGRDPSPHLTAFLGTTKEGLGASRRRLQRAILKQHPELRGRRVDEEVLRAVCGERLRLRRADK